MMLTLQAGGLGRGKGRGTWSPTQFTTPASMWYNDASSVTDAGGGACSQWDDLTTNAYELVQVTGTRQPTIVSGGLNSRRTIRFDGTADYLYTNDAAARDVFRNVSTGTLVTVFKKTATDAGTSRCLFLAQQGGAGGIRIAHYISSGSAPDANKTRLIAARVDGDATGTATASAASGTEWRIECLTMDWANGDGTVYRDGSQVAQNLAITSSGSTSNTASIDSLSLGANRNGGASPTQFSDAEVAEFIVVVALLGTAERYKAEGYTAWRWGLQSNLFAGHPYRFFAP